MVHVNIDFPDAVHRSAKAKASLKGINLKDFILDCVKDNLSGGEFDERS